MKKGKKLFSFIEVTDDTPIQKLSFLEQLRIFVKRITNTDREQLKVESAETVYLLQLKANLLEFLYKATEDVRQGKHRSVTVSISSKFAPVIDEVLQTPSIAAYYNVSVKKPDIDYDIEYLILVTLEVKAY